MAGRDFRLETSPQHQDRTNCTHSHQGTLSSLALESSDAKGHSPPWATFSICNLNFCNVSPAQGVGAHINTFGDSAPSALGSWQHNSGKGQP